MAETESDLREEKKMADKLSKKWGVELVKLPKNYHIDYAAVRDGVTVAYIEFRRRYMNSDKFKTVYLSLKKWLGLCEVDKEAHVPTFWVTQMDDKMLYTRTDGRKLEQTVSGNRHTDAEPVVHIPIKEMKEVKAKKWVDNIEKGQGFER
jgi:hypothetical protein